MPTMTTITKLSLNLKVDKKNNIYNDFDAYATDTNLKKFADAIKSLQNNPYDKIIKTTYTVLM